MFQIQGMFASRETVDEVIDYAARIGKANGDGPGTMTSVMLMYNTVGKLANARIAELEDRIVTAAAYAAMQRLADCSEPNTAKVKSAAADELMGLGMLHDGTITQDVELIGKVLDRMAAIDGGGWRGY